MSKVKITCAVFDYSLKAFCLAPKHAGQYARIQSASPVDSASTLYNIKQCGQILPGLHIGVPRNFPGKISPTGVMSQGSGPISLVQKWHLARAWGARMNQRPTAQQPLHTHYGSLVEEPQLS
jgi:hypothetical protein